MAAKPHQEGKGSAEKQHLAGNAPPLRQPRDGLIDHGAVDTGGNVGFRRALIEQRLNIALRENAAARSYRVKACALQREPIQFVGGNA